MLHRARAAIFQALSSTTKLAPYLHHSYDYMYLPAQLAFIAAEVEQTDPLRGSIVEIGCAFGATTVYLDQHLRYLDSTKRYYALDTFSGFRPEDVEVERHERGRRQENFSGFQRNSRASFERTLRLNGVDRVTAIEADAKTFDYKTIGPFSFCLIDVDLYQPVLASLNAIHELITPGGVIIVDDCDADHPTWRGSYEAYAEFVADKGLPEDIRHTKLGVVRC